MLIYVAITLAGPFLLWTLNRNQLMKKHIKLLLIALGLGLCAFSAHAECPKCDDPGQPPCDGGPDPDQKESMPEGVIVDDMPTAVIIAD
jgi:hypothetical protein